MMDDAKNAARMTGISPEFAVPDVKAAAKYYRDVFGFEITGYFGEATVYGFVRRDNVMIHFGRIDGDAAPSPNINRRNAGLDAYIWVTNLDALFAEFSARGAKIVSPPTHRVYNCYEMEVEDLNGYRLAFAQDDRPASS